MTTSDRHEDIDPRLALVPVHDHARNESRVRTRFWPKLKRVVARIPFANDLVAAYYCATDPDTPTRAKAMLFAGLAYFVLPADAIPDVIAGLGYVDDASVLSAILAIVSTHILPKHREAARKALDAEIPDAKTGESHSGDTAGSSRSSS